VDSDNRTIWTLWMQGVDTAPPLVRACIESWRVLNPTWRVVALDRATLGDWVDLEDIIDISRRDITVQKQAVVARLALLKRYGGVWVDATVFCLRPLDAWLPAAHSAGFTAFRNPGRDRLASNWFMAADSGNDLAVALYEAFIGFFNRHRFTNQETASGRAMVERLGRILNTSVRSTRWWLNPALQAVVRAYPYFIFHYIFNDVVLSDRRLRALWEHAPRLDAGPPHRLQDLGGAGDGPARALAELEQADWVLQKLDWRADPASPYWSAVLERMTALSIERSRQLRGPTP